VEVAAIVPVLQQLPTLALQLTQSKDLKKKEPKKLTHAQTRALAIPNPKLIGYRIPD